MGHSYEKGGVNAMLLTNDNRYVIYAKGNIICLQNKDGKFNKTFIGHNDQITGLALTPDGQKIVSASKDKTVQIWGLYGTDVRTVRIPADGIDCLALTPNGRRVITISWDKSTGNSLMLVWELESSRVLQSIQIGDDMITAIAVAPNSSYAFTASSLTRVIVAWDLENGNQTRVFYNDNGSRKEAVAIAPDGRHVISGGDRGDVTCWDVENENHIYYLLHHEIDTSQPNYWQHPGQFVHSVAFFKNGRGIMSAASDGTIKTWDVATRALKSYADLKTKLTVCVISQDGQSIAAGDESGKVYNLAPEDFTLVT